MRRNAIGDLHDIIIKKFKERGYECSPSNALLLFNYISDEEAKLIFNSADVIFSPNVNKILDKAIGYAVKFKRSQLCVFEISEIKNDTGRVTNY